MTRSSTHIVRVSWSKLGVAPIRIAIHKALPKAFNSLIAISILGPSLTGPVTLTARTLSPSKASPPTSSPSLAIENHPRLSFPRPEPRRAQGAQVSLTDTPTPSATDTYTLTPVPTETVTPAPPTETPELGSPSPTAFSSITPTQTQVSTATGIPSETPTPTGMETETPTPGVTPVATANPEYPFPALIVKVDKQDVAPGDRIAIAWQVVGVDPQAIPADLELAVALPGDLSPDGLGLGVFNQAEGILRIPLIATNGQVPITISNEARQLFYHISVSLEKSGVIISLVDITLRNSVPPNQLHPLAATPTSPPIQLYPGGTFVQTGGPGSFPSESSGDVMGYFKGYTLLASDPSSSPNVYATFRFTAKCTRYGAPYSCYIYLSVYNEFGTGTGTAPLHMSSLGDNRCTRLSGTDSDGTWECQLVGPDRAWAQGPPSIRLGSACGGCTTKVVTLLKLTIGEWPGLPNGPALPDISSLSSCGLTSIDPRGCRVNASSRTQGGAGDPINTRTGAFAESTADISIQTSAGELSFQRTYSSQATSRYTTSLGFGWTHNHDIALILPTSPGGALGSVWFKGIDANQFLFTDNGDGTYTPFPGVLASLTQNAGPPITYTVVDSTQGSYSFNDAGKLQTWKDAQAHTWTYSYDGSGLLSRVTDDTGQRYLQFGYDGQSRITTVADQTGRGIAIGYDTNGDLHTILDVSSKTWTFTYDSAHRLRLVQDPNNLTVAHTEYDTQGRAYQQFDPSGNLVLQITYNTDGSTTILDALNNPATHTYASRNSLSDDKDALNHSTSQIYDLSFRPNTITDKNNNPTHLTWSSTGTNLTQLIDAANGQVDLGYDSLNNLRQVTDARRFLTTYSYNEGDPDPTKRTLLNSTTDALTKTTQFTYTTAADAPQPVGLLKTITDPLNHTTSFVYDQYGQRTSSTDALGKTTNFTYDLLGRLKTVEDPLHHKAWTCYDPFGRVVRSVANATGDGGTPHTDPCDSTNYMPSSDPAFDRISNTIYDDGGRAIATIDPAGVITRTYYDSASRPEYVVQNLYGQGISVPTPPAYDAAYPDRNIRTQTVYDTNSNAIATIDTLGIITRTYYDTLNRPEYVVQNLVGQAISVTTPPTYNPTYPDQNVRTQTVYDAMSNVIATIDNAGAITRTYYDADNRPVTVVQNLIGQTIDNPIPPGRPPAAVDRNLRTDTTYDANGNAIATTDPAGVITRTYFDADNRPIVVALNLYGQAISVETPPTYDPAHPDRNVLTDTYYDDAGNQIAQVDTLGIITRTYYDVANHPEFVVQDLYGQSIYVTTPPTYNPSYPDRNVRTQTVYDDAGRAIGSIDTRGVITRTYYDALGRAQYVARNLTGQAITVTTPPTHNPSYPDQNVLTTTTYDAWGDAIATTDNAGVIARTYYDALHRGRFVTQNLYGQGISVQTPPAYNPAYPDRNVTTETAYDGLGSVVKSIDPIGKATYTCYDGQRRTIKAVLNPSVSSPCGSYTPSSNTDQDLITLTTYDADGNRKTSTDPLSKVTNYAYDGVNRLASETDPLTHATSYGYDVLGNRVSMTDAKTVATSYEFDALARLTAVVENYKPGFNPDQETNVRTEYTYDGLGNRKTIKDARTYVTSFGYDALSRLTSETDPLTHVTTYGFDGVGNRTSLLDTNGTTTTFGYDALNRPTGIVYPAPDPAVTFTYDAAGNRHTMVDGMGTTQWAYDALNRAISITDPMSGVVGYGYDGAGHRTSLTYPDTKHVGYSYDLAGRLHVVTDWDTLQTTYTFDKASRPSTTTLPNSVVSTYSFDDAGRLTGISHVRSSTTLASYTYGVDELGNRTSVTETLRQPAVSATQLWVSDTGNNRQLRFDITTITNGQNAVDLLGQFDEGGSILYTKSGANDGPNVRGFNTPYDSVVDAANHRLFISDTSNNRVLMFNLDASNQLVDRVADAVLGQPNLTSRAAALTASGMNAPRGLALDAGTTRLFVSDTGYNRVLVFNVATVTNGQASINVLGQTTFTAGGTGLAQNRLNGPRGLGLSGTRLFVGDTTNNRVLVFDVSSITNGQNATNVLGQSTFTTNTAATSQTGLSSPRGVAVDSSNRLFVADTNNHRVMVFNVATITNGQAAVNVLGQPDFVTATAATTQTGLRYPEDIVADGSTRLFVGDSSNHRVMVFGITTISNGQAAANVLGQTSFTSGSSATSQGRLNTPYGVSLQGSLLYVADANNHRAMVFDVTTITNGQNAVNLAGQLDGSLAPIYAKNGPNDGPNLLGVNTSGAFAAQVIDLTSHRLFASDATNNRVLVFNLDTNNQLLDRTPDAVLGQTDFYSRTAAAAQNRFSSPRGLALDPGSRRLFVADYSNSRVLVFDVTTVTNGQNAINVLGQTTFTAGSGATAQNRLKNPTGVALDVSRKWLFVGDYNNNRVMVFDVTSITNGQNAINVLGQASFTTATAATTQSGLRYPTGVTVDGGSGRLFVADTNNHRVLLFDVATITNGENAINVLGQPDFVTATAATTQAGMRSPQGVALDPASNRLFVGDTANHRVTVFDVASVTNGENAVNVLGQTNFTSGSAATTQSRMSSPIGVLPVATATDALATITYGYDPLYRLKAADYKTGPFFHYTYDATGNRLTRVTQAGTNNYAYDNANRLTSIDGVTYSWDNNGNLTNDGLTTYGYDHANRLASATQGSNNYVYAYNGQGNRLRQTVNGTPINYTVDINTALPVVLADGTNSYLYGAAVGSVQGAGIGEKQAGDWRYHLGDALASVRQLVDPTGDVKLAQSYEPFGSILSSVGSGSTVFGFTGEQKDGTGLMYLRARYYSSREGRFDTPDTQLPSPQKPNTSHRYLYALNNPTTYTDPSGHYASRDYTSALTLGSPRPMQRVLSVLSPRSGDCVDPRVPEIRMAGNPTLPTALPPLSKGRTEGMCPAAIAAGVLGFLPSVTVEAGILAVEAWLASSGPVGIVVDVALLPANVAVIDLGLVFASIASQGAHKSCNEIRVVLWPPYQW